MRLGAERAEVDVQVGQAELVLVVAGAALGEGVRLAWEEVQVRGGVGDDVPEPNAARRERRLLLDAGAGGVPLDELAAGAVPGDGDLFEVRVAVRAADRLDDRVQHLERAWPAGLALGERAVALAPDPGAPDGEVRERILALHVEGDQELGRHDQDVLALGDLHRLLDRRVGRGRVARASVDDDHGLLDQGVGVVKALGVEADGDLDDDLVLRHAGTVAGRSARRGGSGTAACWRRGRTTRGRPGPGR